MTLGIRLIVPIWDGHLRKGKLIQAKATQEIATQELTRKRLAVNK